MIELRDYVAAAILFDISDNSHSSFLSVNDVSDAQAALGVYESGELPQELVAAALDKILKAGGGRVISDPFTRDFVVLNASECDTILKYWGDDLESPYGKVLQIGRRYIHEALLALQQLPEETLIEGLFDPDSDVIKEIDHNSPEAVQIDQGFADLREQFATGNEAGAIFGDAREALAAEIAALQAMWSVTRVRIRTFLSQAQRTLGWISEKAATSAVGEVAKQLLKALWDFFS